MLYTNKNIIFKMFDFDNIIILNYIFVIIYQNVDDVTP